MTEFGDKVRSIAAPRGLQSKRTVERGDHGALVAHTEHSGGRVDAVVRPDIVRMGARVHNAGKRKGQIAEVRRLTPKERRERYGDRG